MYNDLRYAVRMLLKTPGFTIAAVVTLALGIGASTAIFSVVNAVLLRPLRYKDPERLVLIREAIPKLGGGSIPVSAPDVLDFQQANQVFEKVAAFESLGLDLSGVNEPERLAAARVSYGLFPLLGVPPMLGRSFIIGGRSAGTERCHFGLRSLATTLCSRSAHHRQDADTQPKRVHGRRSHAQRLSVSSDWDSFCRACRALGSDAVLCRRA